MRKYRKFYDWINWILIAIGVIVITIAILIVFEVYNERVRIANSDKVILDSDPECLYKCCIEILDNVEKINADTGIIKLNLNNMVLINLIEYNNNNKMPICIKQLNASQLAIHQNYLSIRFLRHIEIRAYRNDKNEIEIGSNAKKMRPGLWLIHLNET